MNLRRFIERLLRLPVAHAEPEIDYTEGDLLINELVRETLRYRIDWAPGEAGCIEAHGSHHGHVQLHITERPYTVTTSRVKGMWDSRAISGNAAARIRQAIHASGLRIT